VSRYISQYPTFKLQIRPFRSRALGDGGVEVTQEPIYAEFTAFTDGGMVFENEEAAALKHFDFRGNTQLADEATPSDPLQRLSVFDSDEAARKNGWNEAIQAEVETKLDQWAATATQEVLKVTTHPVEPPFPTYDQYEKGVEQLVVKLQEDGHDLETVLYYEQVFGPKRPDIIEGLTKAVENQKAETISA
jgi:hypothetical protein